MEIEMAAVLDAPQKTDPNFDPIEIDEFHQDDASAGKTIGVILTILFTYTAIIMSGVLWWTIRTLG